MQYKSKVLQNWGVKCFLAYNNLHRKSLTIIHFIIVHVHTIGTILSIWDCGYRCIECMMTFGIWIRTRNRNSNKSITMLAHKESKTEYHFISLLWFTYYYLRYYYYHHYYIICTTVSVITCGQLSKDDYHPNPIAIFP